ncbi:MAG: hypothetical protein ACRDMV_06330 [Streptosporangiales bacterium]
MVGDIGPAHCFDPATGMTGRAPPPPRRLSGAVRAAPARQQLPGALAARVGAVASALQHEQGLKNVVVPVRRIVRLELGWRRQRKPFGLEVRL